MAVTETLVGFTPELQTSIRDMILVLADSKRILGMRYGQWLLGAPALEAGIACAAMAQDEWGHARLLYALLREFDEDVTALEHSREPEEYASMDVLDSEPADWPELIALNALADTALSVQCEALRGSSYRPIAQRMGKLLDEERFHDAHGAAWFRRLAGGGEEARTAIRRATTALLPGILGWFGPDSQRAEALVDAGVVSSAGSTLRERYLERIGPLLAELDDSDEIETTAGLTVTPDLAGFDETRRRLRSGGPDPETVAKVRGDKNRAFLTEAS